MLIVDNSISFFVIYFLYFFQNKHVTIINIFILLIEINKNQKLKSKTTIHVFSKN